MKQFTAFLLLIFLLVLPASADALADGSYQADAALTGGTGRVTIQSPAEITVENGRITARIIWSSSSYDQMTVDGVVYTPVSTEGGSTFLIPIRLDADMAITARTTAMSTPHDIEYTLRFSNPGNAGTPPAAILLVGAGVCAVAAVIISLAARKRRAA